jgi:hypothetical protein
MILAKNKTTLWQSLPATWLGYATLPVKTELNTVYFCLDNTIYNIWLLLTSIVTKKKIE